MGKRGRYDRSKPLSDPRRRQFALRVLRERDRKAMEARRADPVSAAVAAEAIARISAILAEEATDE